MNVLAIIPARYASTRFPGKPLINVLGKTMIQRVVEQSLQAFSDVYVATDDERIYKHVESLGYRVVMTSSDHKSGTDRCAEASKLICSQTHKKFDVVVNIQGDEPFIKPEQLLKVVEVFNNDYTQIATLVKEITDPSDIQNPNKVKVVFDNQYRAIYFSRSPIPYVRNYPFDVWLSFANFYKHLGLYAYRYDILQEITQLTRTKLEIAESLEQLRWIENGYHISVSITYDESYSIDTPEDLKKIEEYFKYEQ